MENHDQKPIPDPLKNVSMDGMLNELRNVLAGLGQSEPMPPPPQDETPLAPPPVMTPPPASAPDPKEPPPGEMASDADFWRGNVLGWPTGPEMQAPPPSPPPPPVEMPPIQEPAPISYEKPALEGRPFSLDTPFINPGPLPEELGQEPPPMEIERSGRDVPEPAEEPDPEPFAIPIPGTLSQEIRLKVPSQKADDPLNLEKAELKPPGLVQIACLFPEGQDRQGQQFVAKLRELGEKSKFHLKIDPVFVSGWAEGKVDLVAWTKSATLSGADIMFILAFKKDFDQFRGAMTTALQGAVKTRIIAVEQLALRTLYADILIEFERGR